MLEAMFLAKCHFEQRSEVSALFEMAFCDRILHGCVLAKPGWLPNYGWSSDAEGWAVLCGEQNSGRFHDQAGANTARANADAAYPPVSFPMTHSLQVGIPYAFGLVIGVADVIAFVRCFSAKFTRPHDSFPFMRNTNRISRSW